MKPAPFFRACLATFLAFLLAVPTHVFAMGPLERNHPAIERGTDAYNQGRYDDALQAFEEAQKQLPDKPAVEFNRGNALYKLGKLDDARQAYQHAMELDRNGELKESDYYNLGNTWAAMHNDKEAVAAYRRALTLDPNDEMARHNLEVILRKLPPPSQPTPDGGTDGGHNDGGQDAGRPDGGQDGGVDGGSDGGSGPDGGMDGGRPDAGPQDGGSGRDGGQGDGGMDGGHGKGEEQQQDAGSGEGEGEDGGSGDDTHDQQVEEGDQDGGVDAVNKKDAERILDSMRRFEKNLQLWRFQQKKQRPRKNDKDW